MRMTNETELLEVIAENTRMTILQSLSGNREKCATEILSEMDITQPTLSHHLNLMAEYGILKIRKEGRKVYYSINGRKIEAINTLLTSLLTESAPAKAASRKPSSPKTASAKTASSKAAKPSKDKSSKDLKDTKKKDKKDKKEKKDKKDKKDKKKKKK